MSKPTFCIGGCGAMLTWNKDAHAYLDNAGNPHGMKNCPNADRLAAALEAKKQQKGQQQQQQQIQPHRNYQPQQQQIEDNVPTTADTLEALMKSVVRLESKIDSMQKGVTNILDYTSYIKYFIENTDWNTKANNTSNNNNISNRDEEQEELLPVGNEDL